MHDGAIILLIPIIAIICNTVVKLAKLGIEPFANRSNTKNTAELEKRVMELEHRVTTLQNLVIDGEYQVRRKLEHQHMAPTPPSYVAHEIPQQPNPVNTLGG
jgi:hypothetical protein